MESDKTMLDELYQISLTPGSTCQFKNIIGHWTPVSIPCKLISAGAGQQHGLLGNVSHCVARRVSKVHGVVYSCVVKLHVDGIVLLVIVASHCPDRVPHLRERERERETASRNIFMVSYN